MRSSPSTPKRCSRAPVWAVAAQPRVWNGGGEELFVSTNDRLQVFSLAGEHRRSITGEWKRPKALCFVKDRMYLVEEEDTETDQEGNLIGPTSRCW